MKHLLEFNQWNDKGGSKYTVIDWDKASRDEEHIPSEIDDDGDNDLSDYDREMDFFNVRIEDESGEEHTIAVNFQIFIEFMGKEMPNLQSYLSNISLDSLDEVFDDLESLGIDFKDMLQKWVDDNVTQDTLDVDSEGEEGEGMFADEEGNIYTDEDDDMDDEYIDDEEDDSY